MGHLNIIIARQSTSLGPAMTQYRFKCMLVEQLKRRRELLVEKQKSKCVLDHHRFYLPQLQKRLNALKQQTIAMSKSYGRKIRLGALLQLKVRVLRCVRIQHRLDTLRAVTRSDGRCCASVVSDMRQHLQKLICLKRKFTTDVVLK